MNPLTLAVSKVNIGSSSSATGFFYRSGDDIFFITNKHVVKDKNDNYYDLCIFQNYLMIDRKVKSGASLSIRSDIVQHITFFHENDDVDIAVLWIIGNKGFVRNLSELTNDDQIRTICCLNDIGQTDISAEVADNVFIIGYPFGISAERGISHGSPKPIWKCGTIATEMSLNYDVNNLGSFLIDATGQQGNSGSPVVAYAGSGSGMIKTSDGGITMLSGGGLIYKILGIMSAILIVPSSNEKSDLCVIWKKKLIDEIIKKIMNN